MAAENLTPAEVTAICTAAQEAWDKISPQATKAPFTWRGKRYVATHTLFRLCVDTADGLPVACRYD